MTMPSAIKISDASSFKVDTSCIDVSEVESKEDKAFLKEKGENILRIIARAALEVGQQVCEVQDHFQDKGQNGLLKWYASIQITPTQAITWSNKYRAFMAYVEMFGEEGARESFKELPDYVGEKIWNLPTRYRQAFLADIALGNPPSGAAVLKATKDPEVKLNKAEELLEAARARKELAEDNWEAIKADPSIPCRVNGKDNPEYAAAAKHNQQASKTLRAAEERVATLLAEVEAEKAKTKQVEEAKALIEEQLEKTKAEIQKMKFDDATMRNDRIRRVSNTLLASIPAVLADVQRFYAEIEHYDKDTVLYLEEQLKTLIDYTKDHL